MPEIGKRISHQESDRTGTTNQNDRPGRIGHLLPARNKVFAVAALVLVVLMPVLVSGIGASAVTVSASPHGLPQYNHIFLLVMENEGYYQVIGNTHSPILNALAQD